MERLKGRVPTGRQGGTEKTGTQLKIRKFVQYFNIRKTFPNQQNKYFRPSCVSNGQTIFNKCQKYQSQMSEVSVINDRSTYQNLQ